MCGLKTAAKGLGRAEFPAKPLCLSCALLFLGLSGAASITLASEPPNSEDLTQGTWLLNLARSNFCTPAPRKSKREIINAGWGLISVHWTGIDAMGEPIDVHYVYRYDGEKYPSTIDRPANEAITWKLVSPFRIEFTHWSKDNEITEELVRTVSSDGQEMIQTRKYIDTEGCIDTQVFERQ